jgi:LysM repeat protein
LSFILSASLSLGLFLVPHMADADIFSSLSSIFGAKVSADTVTDQSPSQNSQNMSILESNMSPIQILADNSSSGKSSSDSSGLADDSSSGTSDGTINGNSLTPDSSLNSSQDGSDDSFSPDQISVYVVRDGDTLSQIAEMFGVSVNTIRWANDMTSQSVIQPGDVLLILPMNGIEYTVQKGDTMSSIAKKYNADVEDIAKYNNLADNASLSVGDQIIIPNGQMMDEGGSQPAANLSQNIAKDKQYYQSHPSLQNLSGYYEDPVPGYVLTQGLHANNGVDLAVPSGTPIHAAAAGRVSFARDGWNGGYGNLVIIDHPNGTQTLYAHQSKIATQVGAQVSQGEVIGYVGTTGHSTGPHLHFEVHGARNPGVDGSWK